MTEEVKTEEVVTNEETGATEKVVEETKAEVKMVTLEEAQKMVDKAIAKKLPPKEEMDAYKQWKESQKTDADKQAEKDKELVSTKQTNESLAKENAVLRKGVNEDDIDYVVYKVSKMDGEFKDNLEVFLKDNPKYLTKEETKVVTTTGVKTNGAETKEGGVTAILKAKHPELFKD